MIRTPIRRRMATRLVAALCATSAVVAFGMVREHRGVPHASAEAVELGRRLFTHEWIPDDPLAHGDGLGPVFNDVSCARCHRDPGLGGSGPTDKNAVQFDVRKLVTVQRPVIICSRESHVEVQVPMASSLEHGGIHKRAIAPELQESTEILVQALECESDRRLEVTARNTMSLFGAGLIDSIPDSAILASEGGRGTVAAISDLWSYLRGGSDLAVLFQHDTVHGRASRVAHGRVGRFGWRADFATLQEFTEAACANELGLSNPGHDQPAPLVRPDYASSGLDLTREECEAITAFLRAMPRPIEESPADPVLRAAAAQGKELFAATGCAACHTPKLGPVAGIYSDLLLHDMADPKTGPYGASLKPELDPSELKRPSESEWRTPPLWGVADSAPYMHDGSAATLEAAIRAHHGAGRGSARRFEKLTGQDRESLVAFLKTLRAPNTAREKAAVVAARD